MSAADRFTYEEGDVEIKDSYCEFCKHYIEGTSIKCGLFPDGKPETIMNLSEMCSKFSIKE